MPIDLATPVLRNTSTKKQVSILCHTSETLEAARILSMENAGTMAHSHSGVPATLKKSEVFMDKQRKCDLSM